MMKKIFTAAAIGAMMATSPLAFAADNKGKDVTVDMNKPTDPAATPAPLEDDTTGSISSSGASMMSESDIGGWTSGDYRVVRLSELDPTSSDYTRISEMSTSKSDEVSKTQAAIRANSALSAKLQGENVQIENIVSAEKAADGSVVFYLK